LILFALVISTVGYFMQNLLLPLPVVVVVVVKVVPVVSIIFDSFEAPNVGYFLKNKDFF
jgi:hypothetical protein